MKILMDNLPKELESTPEILFCSTSFEKRWCSVALKLAGISNEIKLVIVRQSGDFSEVDAEVDKLKEYYSGAEIYPLLNNSTKDIFNIINERYVKKIKSVSGYALIDITTMSHEYLLILLKILYDNKLTEKVKLIYTGAEEYSFNTPKEEKWLSKGVRDIRSILGYPGYMLPSRKSHLILLVGFEYERAQQIILEYEPAVISLGLGAETKSYSTQHHQTNRIFFEKIMEFVESFSGSRDYVHSFEFSCVSPTETERKITEQIALYENYNSVLYPMNTKVSSIAAAIVGIKNEGVQLCYAEPVEYNYEGYSTPGNSVTIFEFDGVF